MYTEIIKIDFRDDLLYRAECAETELSVKMRLIFVLQVVTLVATQSFQDYIEK